MKRGLDLLLASTALLVLAPLMIFLALVVRVVHGSPVLFAQPRSGKMGEEFTLLKFRTMSEGPDDPTTDQERLTVLGRILRACSLDELPSLFNVIKGEMSLVGPRPLPVRYLERYSDEQLGRLRVRPGITGLAQVSGRNLLSWEERFELDLQYVATRSFLGDIRILTKTVAGVVRRDGVATETGESTPEFTGGHG
ncbi:MAG: sugar transferase [Acidimicrobiia bacterium]|nr:sugar transferase [Acidimicrobiia bacterium]